MAPGCTEFYRVQSGNSCYSIEQAYGISASDFEDRNPDVGTDCANGVWLDYYYCVSHSTGGGSSSSAGPTSVQPTFYSSSHLVTIQPQPTHTLIYPSKPIPPVVYVTGTPPPPPPPPAPRAAEAVAQVADAVSMTVPSLAVMANVVFFGCDGGCGLGFCGGGCGLEGCGPGCGDGKFVKYPFFFVVDQADKKF